MLPHSLGIFLILNIINASTSSPQIIQITAPTTHAEGPVWDNRTQTLYFVDIPLGKLFAYHYKPKNISIFHFPGQLSIVVPNRHDPHQFIIALNRSLLSVKYYSKSANISSIRHLITLQEEFPASRFNDGKADAKGRLWMGTMGAERNGKVAPNEGRLYRIGGKLKADVMLQPVNISNGLAWNLDNSRFYYIDTPSRRVLQYDFDVESGEISKQVVCFDLAWVGATVGGAPDGMTIDVGGMLWIAMYGGGAVLRVDPKRGRLLQVVRVPVRDVTSVMWGGPGLDVLFVTTSRKDLTVEEVGRRPWAGSVFKILNLGTKGVEVYTSTVE